MTISKLWRTGGAAAALSLVAAGATAVEGRSAVDTIMKRAEADAASAQAALGKHKAGAAITFAERAAQARPQDATYRALLGRAYLAGGRFFSARQAFADALQLDSGAAVALNYALVTTATGDFAAAQRILTDYAAVIAPADRGLALALAGDPAGGVEVLIAAARSPDSNAKVRQNLALTLALAGRWAEARQMALADLSPADADARIMQWASFARPAAASDQVSTLLGVTPVADQGVPQQLALVAAPQQIAADAVEPAPAPAPASVSAAGWTPDTPLADPAVTKSAVAATSGIPTPAAPAVPSPTPATPQVIFAERRAVVQPLPPQRAGTVARGGLGNYYVQLGAYRGLAAARAGWQRARAKHTVLASRSASTMPIPGNLIRVSVGGFARADANQLCRTIRADGGACFVRAGAGDRTASWGGPQVAAR